jgi:SNF2 family DNA or RNA helicase
VRDYINIYTPYRGLLLYHGLGSGKTCSSIAIAEGIKNEKRILIMTPASLRSNYIEELKKCGDYLYKKNQYWEFA